VSRTDRPGGGGHRRAGPPGARPAGEPADPDSPLVMCAGDPAYEDFYLAFDDREQPDAYERTIVPVFPDRTPGSFTWFVRRR
jgi:hypothetical protein